MSDTRRGVYDTRSTVYDTRATVHDTRITVHDTRTKVRDTRTAVHDTRTTVYDTRATVYDTHTTVSGGDWYFIAKQPASVPHLAHQEGCAALRIVLVTVPRVSRSCKHFPDGSDLHL